MARGRCPAAGVPLPSDHVERIEVLVTLKPGVRLMNVGRSCAHVAVDLAIASADEKSAAE